MKIKCVICYIGACVHVCVRALVREILVYLANTVPTRQIYVYACMHVCTCIHSKTSDTNHLYRSTPAQYRVYFGKFCKHPTSLNGPREFNPMNGQLTDVLLCVCACVRACLFLLVCFCARCMYAFVYVLVHVCVSLTSLKRSPKLFLTQWASGSNCVLEQNCKFSTV